MISIAIFYVVTRMVLLLNGVQFIADYRFMIFHSIELLESNLLESIWYTHSFTVFMNIIAGVALKLPQALQIPFYQLIYYSASIILLISFGKILEFFNISALLNFGVLAIFCCLPAFIYFENFLIYTHLVCCLLTLSIAILIQAFQKNTFRLWFMFFFLCALLSFIRTSYHLVWLVVTLVIVVIIDFTHVTTKVKSFIMPFSLIFLWYLKNLILFGFFGASSMLGLNLALITVKNLSNKEKRVLVKSNQISSVSEVSIFAGIDKYKNYINYKIEDKTGIAVLDEINKSQGKKNFNHIGFIEVAEKRMEDNLTYLKLYTKRYIKNVFQENVKDFLRPSTKWHPSDRPGYKIHQKKSPHIPNRKILGKWEELHNNLVHYKIGKPIGFYWFTLLAFLYFIIWKCSKFLKRKKLTIKDKILILILFNIFYLAAISCLFSSTELERYRFTVEPLLWTITILFLISIIKKLTALYQKQDAD